MGSADMKAAFNAISEENQAATALLWYERDEQGGEWQVLLFRGSRADGTAFEVKSDRHSPNADPIEVARETAQKFIDDNSVKDSA